MLVYSVRSSEFKTHLVCGSIEEVIVHQIKEICLQVEQRNYTRCRSNILVSSTLIDKTSEDYKKITNDALSSIRWTDERIEDICGIVNLNHLKGVMQMLYKEFTITNLLPIVTTEDSP